MKDATSATIVFHGPDSDRTAGARALGPIVRLYAGKYSTNSFWVHRQQRWHSPETEGLRAHCVAVPVRHYRAAVRMARAITKDPDSNVWVSHHWSNSWPTQETPKKVSRRG